MTGFYSCGKKCEKPLKGCRHYCHLSCHDGVCSEKCEEEVKVVCKCGCRVEKRCCSDVQQLPGYDAAKPIQVVLPCNETCKKEEVKEINQEVKSVVTSPSHQNWIYIAVFIVILAILIGVGLKFKHYVFFSNTQITKKLTTRSRSIGGRSMCIISTIMIVIMMFVMLTIGNTRMTSKAMSPSILRRHHHHVSLTSNTGGGGM